MFSRINAPIKRIVTLKKNLLKKNQRCDKTFYCWFGEMKNDKNMIDFNYKIILKRNITAPALGRWRVDKKKREEDKTIDWANHDHCGSDSCTLEDAKFDETEEETKEENEKDSEKMEFSEEEYIQQHLTGFVI